MNFSQAHVRSYFTALLCVVALLFTASCNGDKGKVEGTNMLYGSGSKTWVTDKQKDASGNKMDMSDAQKDAEFTFTSSTTYTAMEGGQSQTGSFTMDQAAKTLTLTPQGSPTSSTFKLDKLDDDKLTLVGTDGSSYVLKAK